MTSEDALLGTRVEVREEHRVARFRKLRGTIRGRWGGSRHVAVDVLLDDGRMQLFWPLDLEEIRDPLPARSRSDPTA